MFDFLFNPLVVFLVLALVCGGVAVWYLRLRRPPPPPEPAAGRFFCPQCQCRMGYRASRAGQKVRCPRCQQVFTYPAKPLEPDAEMEEARRQRGASLDAGSASGPDWDRKWE